MLVGGRWVITSSRRVNDRLVELSVTNNRLQRYKVFVQRRHTSMPDLHQVLAAHDPIGPHPPRLR